MQDYIKRKKKQQQPTQIKRPEVEAQIIIRQTQNQINELTTKLDGFEQRLSKIRQKIGLIYLELDQLKQKGSIILAMSSSKKPQVEDIVSDRPTQKPKPDILQPNKLGRVKNVDQKISNSGFKRLRSATVDDKLSQTGLPDVKNKSATKKTKLDD